MLAPLGALTNYMTLVLGTTYYAWFGAFSGIFFGWTALLMYILESFFSDLKDDPNFSYALDPLATFAAFVFLPYLNETQQGYSAEQTVYRVFIDRLIRLPMVCAKASHVALRPYIFALGEHGDQMRRRPKAPARPYFGGPSENLEAELRADAAKLDFSGATFYLIARLKGALSPGDASGDAEVNVLFDMLQAWASKEKVKEPGHMKAHMLLFLFAWYAVWLPIVIWARAGVSRAIVVVPVVFYVLWGTSVLRLWLGSDWDIYRPFKETKHEKWGQEARDAIDAIIELRSKF
jgi:hypothetical protein